MLSAWLLVVVANHPITFSYLANKIEAVSVLAEAVFFISRAYFADQTFFGHSFVAGGNSFPLKEFNTLP